MLYVFQIFIIAVFAGDVTAVMQVLNHNIGFSETTKIDGWKGKWFPENPYNKSMDDSQGTVDHRVLMGVKSQSCDDGKTNLTLDWDGLESAYSCFLPKKLYQPDYNMNSISECVHIPAAYFAPHVCMNEPIYYEDWLPTFGPHRPLWPRYGEYNYVPKQRWLHTLEHGGVVMLYHPCANTQEVKKLKNLVKSCLYRHVITPYRRLTAEHPLALVTWGCRLTMSVVEPEIVKSFINAHALRGPEQLSKDGQYSVGLIEPAKVVSDIEDTQLCQMQSEK